MNPLACALAAFALLASPALAAEPLPGSNPIIHDRFTADPAPLVVDNTAWLAWGNPNLYLARLKPNMTELDGPIQRIFVPNYTKGPWLHKRGGLYYLTYAAFAHQGFPERICHARATSVAGPWAYRGILTGAAYNSYTIHPAVIDFKGQSYFFYHDMRRTPLPWRCTTWAPPRRPTPTPMRPAPTCWARSGACASHMKSRRRACCTWTSTGPGRCC